MRVIVPSKGYAVVEQAGAVVTHRIAERFESLPEALQPTLPSIPITNGAVALPAGMDPEAFKLILYTLRTIWYKVLEIETRREYAGLVSYKGQQMLVTHAAAKAWPR